MDKKRSKKSTLTQQQRNNKRQRANAQQLDVLRHEYRLCATPDAATRRRISALIDMTERSVQIWFQNTRAKQKKALRGGREQSDEYEADVGLDDLSPSDVSFADTSLSPTHDAASVAAMVSTPVQASFPHLLATPPTTSSHATADSPASSITDFSSLGGITPNLTPTTPHHVALPPIFFPTLSLTIGNWRRLSPQLSLAYYPSTDTMLYHMTSDKTQFRMQFPFSAIEEIHVSRNPNDTLGALNLTLNQAPSFSIQTPKAPGRWVGCHDFSEGKQASHVTTHVCNGPATVLQQQLSRVFALRSNHVARRLSHNDLLAGVAVDTSNHMISSHVGDFDLSVNDPTPQPQQHEQQQPQQHEQQPQQHEQQQVCGLEPHVTSHVTPVAEMPLSLTSTVLGNVTPGHTTPVMDTGFDLAHVTELDALVNVSHLLPNHHAAEDDLSANCHMIANNAFTLDPSTPLSPFAGTLDYLEYY
ncbi:Homeobox protein [Yarrowia sp. C11]|nr:Homeobox protein [Yarrowia sp. E02]KAG5369838.1 Homeobox protein [Yarrowia sp. C11]